MIEVAPPPVVEHDPAPIYFYLIPFPPDPLPSCLSGLGSGDTCSGLWIGQYISSLRENRSIDITPQSESFVFFLGNHLSGAYLLSLFPAYTSAASWPDEFSAFLAADSEYVGFTRAGEFLFRAEMGTEYYVMLGGLMRGGETYTLALNAVPEPDSSILLLAGLGLLSLATLRRRKNTRG